MTAPRCSEAEEVKRSPSGEWLSRYFSAPRTMVSAASVVSSTAWSVLIGVSTTVVAFLSSILIARTLGPSKMGDYSYWMWLIGTVTLLMDLGIASATMKFSAELLGKGGDAAASALVSKLLKAQLVLSAVISATFVLYVLLAGPATGVAVYAMVAASLLIAGPASVTEGAIRGALDYRFAGHVTMVSGAFQLIVVAAIVHFGGGVRELLLAWLATSAVFFIPRYYRMCKLYPKPSVQLSPEVYSSVFRYCRSKVGLSFLDAIVWARSEVLFLGLFSAHEQIAFYSLAYGTASQLIMGATLIAHPLVPTFSALSARHDVVRMAQLYRAAVRYVAFVSFPLAIGGVVVAKPLLIALYTDAYAPAAPVLMIVAASSLAVAVMFVCSAVLYGLGRPDYLVRINVVLALINLLASILLIPRYGAIGAAVANAIGPVLSVIVAVLLLEKVYGFKFPAIDVAKILGAAAAAALFASVVVRPAGWPSLLAGSAVGAVAYVFGVILLRVFDDDDQHVFLQFANGLPWRLKALCLRMVNVLAAAPSRP